MNFLDSKKWLWFKLNRGRIAIDEFNLEVSLSANIFL